MNPLQCFYVKWLEGTASPFAVVESSLCFLCVSLHASAFYHFINSELLCVFVCRVVLFFLCTKMRERL